MTSLAKTARSAAMILAALGMGTAAADEPTFDLKSVKGAWGFSGDGVLAAPDLENRLPIAGIGVVTFDGEGGCDISGTNNVNGMAVEVQSDYCSYEVNPDGTGKSEASFPAMGPMPASDVPVSFVIVDGARELRLMQTAIIVSSFVAKRIEPGNGRYRRR